MEPTTRTARRLALVGIVGPVLWWVLVVVNGALTPGYSHVSDFISTLGAVGAPYATIQTINFAVFGSAVLAATITIHHWFDAGRRPRVGTVLLGVFGVGVVLAGIFPADRAAPDATTNLLHDLVSTIAFVTGIAGVSLTTRRIDRDERWPTRQYELFGTVVLVLATFVVFMYSIAVDSTYLGVTQRLFIGLLTLWVILQSSRLYRLLGGLTQQDTDEPRADSVDT